MEAVSVPRNAVSREDADVAASPADAGVVAAAAADNDDDERAVATSTL